MRPCPTGCGSSSRRRRGRGPGRGRRRRRARARRAGLPVSRVCLKRQVGAPSAAASSSPLLSPSLSYSSRTRPRLTLVRRSRKSPSRSQSIGAPPGAAIRAGSSAHASSCARSAWSKTLLQRKSRASAARSDASTSTSATASGVATELRRCCVAWSPRRPTMRRRKACALVGASAAHLQDRQPRAQGPAAPPSAPRGRGTPGLRAAHRPGPRVPAQSGGLPRGGR